MRVFRGHLSVVSTGDGLTDLPPQLAADLPVRRRRGVPVRPGGPVAGVSEWCREIASGGAVADFDALADELQGWGLEFAGRLGDLVRQVEGVSVCFDVVQEIQGPDDAVGKGVHLGAGLVAWLARAAASVDIDQYVEGP
jgi:hypothetical protein